MKKFLQYLLITAFVSTLFSCGAFDKHEIAKSDNLQKMTSSPSVNSLSANQLAEGDPIRAIGFVQIPVCTKGFDPKELFSTKEDKSIAKFYQFGNFENFLYDNAEKVQNCSTFALNRYQLIRNTSDSEILSQTKAMPLSETEFFVALVDLISRQPKGESGILLTNGHANIFHVSLKNGTTVAAYAMWDANYKAWSLRAQASGEWVKDGNLFSRKG